MKKISWVLRLPEGGVKVRVVDGERVNEGEVLYESKQGKTVKLPIVGWGGLSNRERKKIGDKITGRELVEGELLWRSGWFGRQQLRAPRSGMCVGIDELGNILFEDNSMLEFRSPVTAAKVRVEKGRIVLELKGWEIAAEGVSQVKGWGEFKGTWLSNLADISVDMAGQTVIVEGEEAVIAKAEAVGVKGIIVVEGMMGTDFKEADIPMVKIERKEADNLVKLSKGTDKAKLWLNPISGKVWLVL